MTGPPGSAWNTIGWRARSRRRLRKSTPPAAWSRIWKSVCWTSPHALTERPSICAGGWAKTASASITRRTRASRGASRSIRAIRVIAIPFSNGPPMDGLGLPSAAYKDAPAASKPCNDPCSNSDGFSSQGGGLVSAERRKFSAVCILALSIATIGRQSWAGPQAPSAPVPSVKPDQDWIARSNGYTELLLDVTKKHSPETASAEGLAQFDEQISQPTKHDEDAAIAETKEVQAQLTRALQT